MTSAWQKVAHKPAMLAIAAGVLVVGGGFIALHHAGMLSGKGLDALRYKLALHPSVKDLQQELVRDPRDVKARLALAHDYQAQGARGMALAEYERALKQDPKLSSSTMAADLVACFGTAQQSGAAALIGGYKLAEATEGLEKLTADKRSPVRTGALATLERLGRASHQDSLRVWTAELESPECDAKRQAVVKLGELGDRRALQPIKTARAKDDEATPWYKSRCIGDRSEDAERKILAQPEGKVAHR